MHYPSRTKSWKQRCLCIYYDYRKIAAIFLCYSLLGTCFILHNASITDEETIFYQLCTGQPSLAAKQSIDKKIQNLTSQTVTYRLTGTTTSLNKMPDTTANASKDSQQEARKDTAQTAKEDKKKTPTKQTDYDISQFSKKEIRILERIVEAEAGDQSLKGRMMVAHVVLNRVASKEFPNTIKEVVFQNNNSVYQFSPIKDGRYHQVTVSKKTKKAVAKAFASKDSTDGALYFMSRSGSSQKSIQWFDSALTKITSHGCHEFFK